MTLQLKDRVIVALLVAFSIFNVTIDLYLVVNAPHLAERASRGEFTAFWALYADADRLWITAPWSRAQEAINVFAATLLNAWLIWAIVRRRSYRHALQLALGAFLSYSVILYYLAGHLSGYEGMRSGSAGELALFYGAALPWLLGHLYMTYDSATAITRRFASAPPATR
jgi:cholestenol Delta-isomerase